jgi:glycosyltransferase involved in cell wall biosynthesis
MSIAVSIIIPTLGHVENLKRLLLSIDRQTVNFSEIEVLLIANGQTAEEFQNLKNNLSQNRDYAVSFFHLESKGVSAARNLGLQKAQGSILYFLDDDCELHLRNTLGYHIDQHRQHPELLALGGGYLLPSRAGLFDEIYNHIQMSWFVKGQSEDEGQLKPCQYLLGGNFSAKRQLLIQHQIRFNDAIAYGGSESALFKQAALIGLPLCACSVEVTHHTEETAGSIRRKVYKQGRGQSLINQKYPAKSTELISPTQQPAEVVSQFKLWLLFYNYVFWSGYFSAEGKPLKILGQMFSDLKDKFNGWRFAVVDRLNQKKK